MEEYGSLPKDWETRNGFNSIDKDIVGVDLLEAPRRRNLLQICLDFQRKQLYYLPQISSNINHLKPCAILIRLKYASV